MTDSITDELDLSPDMALDAIIADLDEMDIKLLMDRCHSWGGWMWDAGKKMAALGIASRNGGNIQFDTPLAERVKKRILEKEAAGV